MSGVSSVEGVFGKLSLRLTTVQWIGPARSTHAIAYNVCIWTVI